MRVRGSIQKISGDNSERDPPVPIPNTEVKPLSADGTWLATARESRTSPGSRERRCWRSEEASPTSYSPRWMWDQRMGNGWRGRTANADTRTPGPRRQTYEAGPRRETYKGRPTKTTGSPMILSSSMAEHSAVNRVVVGSSPTWGAGTPHSDVRSFLLLSNKNESHVR